MNLGGEHRKQPRGRHRAPTHTTPLRTSTLIAGSAALAILVSGAADTPTGVGPAPAQAAPYSRELARAGAGSATVTHTAATVLPHPTGRSVHPSSTARSQPAAPGTRPGPAPKANGSPPAPGPSASSSPPATEPSSSPSDQPSYRRHRRNQPAPTPSTPEVSPTTGPLETLGGNLCSGLR